MEQKIYVIHAYEGIYSGLYGIEAWIIERTTEKAAEDIGIEESINLMEGYSFIRENFEEEAEDEGFIPGSKEYYDYIGDCEEENVMYDLYEVIKTDGKSIDELELLLIEFPEDFIEEYCKVI